MTDRCRRCAHPEAWHDGPEGGPQCPGCSCPGWRDPDPDQEYDPPDDDMPAWARPDTAGPTETTRAAWRQHEETHR